MPKVWKDTIEEHRRAVRDATLDTTAALVAKHGLASVTMSQIAKETGIGRATLYKYFPDVESILMAWHEREVGGHLELLAKIGTDAGGPVERLRAVLETYALIRYEHSGHALAALVHRGEHAARAQQQFHEFIRDLLAEGSAAKELREDVSPDELAGYCLNAVNAVGGLSSKAAVLRLVTVILDGLRS